jgi:hypothetical protein
VSDQTPTADDMQPGEVFVAGWRERIALPDLGIPRLRAKLDTGAKTSALCARRIEMFERDGEPWVRFNVWPGVRGRAKKVSCEAPVVDIRTVRSSTGHEHTRPVIHTHVVMGEHRWPIEVTLAKRRKLKFRMLLGRQALAGRCLVDSGGSYLVGRPALPPRAPRRTS